jgi:sugar lactone lactonase YvrE
MQVARAGHTATRLKNGVVLIAGGRNGAVRLASSELYIPRLPYEASVLPTPRGGSDPLGSYDYGSWLAAATNSHNNLLISYAGGSGDATRLIEWDPRPWAGGARYPKYRRQPYVRALGRDLPDLNSIRVDEHDNIWGASSAGQEIFKISSEGKMLLRFGKPEPTDTNSPSDTPRTQRLRRHVENPSDVAVDRRGNVFVIDAGERPRIVKFDSRGRFLAAAGRKGSRPGDLDSPRSMATDASGNVYVADSGNARIQVFDNSLNLRAVYRDIGTPWAVCISKGSRQFLYSTSNRDKNDDRRSTAEIYKLELDGTILGKAVGDESGKSLSTSRHFHCRQANTIFGIGQFTSHEITFAK